MAEKFPDSKTYLGNVSMFGPGVWEQYKQSQTPQELKRAETYMQDILHNEAPDIEPHGAGRYIPPPGTPNISALPMHLQEDEDAWLQSIMEMENPPPLEDFGRMLDERTAQEQRFAKQDWDELPPVNKLMEVLSYVPDLLEPGAASGVQGAQVLFGSPATRKLVLDVLKSFRRATKHDSPARRTLLKRLKDKLMLGEFTEGGAFGTFEAKANPREHVEKTVEGIERLQRQATKMRDAVNTKSPSTPFYKEAVDLADRLEMELVTRKLQLERDFKRLLKGEKNVGRPAVNIAPRGIGNSRKATTAHEVAGHAADPFLEDVANPVNRRISDTKLKEIMLERGFEPEYAAMPSEQAARYVEDSALDVGRYAIPPEEEAVFREAWGLDVDKWRGSLK